MWMRSAIRADEMPLCLEDGDQHATPCAGFARSRASYRATAGCPQDPETRLRPARCERPARQPRRLRDAGSPREPRRELGHGHDLDAGLRMP
jgi:hypothetical protein